MKQCFYENVITLFLSSWLILNCQMSHSMLHLKTSNHHVSFLGFILEKSYYSPSITRLKKILCLLNTDRNILKKWLEFNFKQHILARKGKRRKTTYMYIDFFLSFALWFNTRSHNCHVYKIAPFRGIQDSLVFWIPHSTVDSGFQRVDSSLCHWKLDSKFQSLEGFWLPWAAYPNSKAGRGLQIPRVKISRFPDSSSKNFPSSGIRIPLRGD